MGQITYKAFGKKFQNPGAVITALTFLWAWREDGNHLAIEQYKQVKFGFTRACRGQKELGKNLIKMIKNYLV